jgi:transketolase
MRKAFVGGLIEAAKADPSIWLVNADLGFSVLEPFAELFPDRYLNIGVAEQNMIGVATGLALSGFKVFVYSIANFSTQRCLEQIRVDVCYHSAHVIVVAVGAGFAYGVQGYTHHAIEDMAVMRALPNMRVISPCDPAEARAFTLALARNRGPGYLRLGRGGERAIRPDSASQALSPSTLLREGDDVALLATGSIVEEAVRAADILAGVGVSARVISVPQVKPLELTLLLAQIATSKLVATIEEHSLIGGLRDAVAPALASSAGSPRLLGFGVQDGLTIGVNKGQVSMRAHCGLDAVSIAHAIQTALQR